ncbi:hypothetical protein [Maricaulis sp.]|nr:hypothetical protein [Maricaulis sp.]
MSMSHVIASETTVQAIRLPGVISRAQTMLMSTMTTIMTTSYTRGADDVD